MSTVVWLKTGHSTDVGPAGTDGHLDGVAAFVAPGHVMLEAPHDPDDAEYAGGVANLAALTSARDARGRAFQISQLDPGPEASVPNPLVAWWIGPHGGVPPFDALVSGRDRRSAAISFA